MKSVQLEICFPDENGNCAKCCSNCQHLSFVKNECFHLNNQKITTPDTTTCCLWEDKNKFPF